MLSIVVKSRTRKIQLPSGGYSAFL